MATSVKHFAANSNEDFRFVGDSLVDERALREIYLPAFERVVTDAQPATVMCAYNALNGTFCSDNRELLTGILREEWGFDGVVMTDWGATHDRIASINAGCELDMPGQVAHNRAEIVAGVADGRILPDVLDTAVAPHAHPGRPVCAASRSIERRRGGSRRARPRYRDRRRGAPCERRDPSARPRQPFARRGGRAVREDALPGCRFLAHQPAIGDHSRRTRSIGAASPTATRRAIATLASGRDARLERTALEAARDAETVLFFAGLSDLEESEGFDRTTMALGTAQTALLEELLDAGANVVLVLFAGAPVELPFADRLAAILDMYLPGMHGGEATAALLFGEANPSGKLTETLDPHRRGCELGCGLRRVTASRGTTSRSTSATGSTTKRARRCGSRSGTGCRTRASPTATLRCAWWMAGSRHPQSSPTLARATARRSYSSMSATTRDGVFKADKELRAFTKVRLDAGDDPDG